jgi:hypothetical protein
MQLGQGQGGYSGQAGQKRRGMLVMKNTVGLVAVEMVVVAGVVEEVAVAARTSLRILCF